MDANEKRKQEVKKNSVAMTKAREAPFSFYERDKTNWERKKSQQERVPDEMLKPQFKAKPIPWACSMLLYDQMTKKDKQERQERIMKNA